MDATDTEFSYTFLPADGSLTAIQSRFRITASGPKIRDAEGNTASKDPQAGDVLLIPKPDDIPWFAKANWSAFPAIPGETLPALIKRIHAAGPETRVLHQDADMTPGYVWHDWHNADLRQSLLVPADTAIADSPKTDLDPKTLAFKGGENVSLPLKALKQHVANVAPGTTGGTAPPATVDVSDSDFEKLRNALILIENELNNLASLRHRAVDIQAHCNGRLNQVRDLRNAADATNQMLLTVHPILGDQGRAAFIQAMDALIDKAAPALLNAPYTKIKPSLTADDFPDALTNLRSLITDRSTLGLLAKVVPLKGEIPWVLGDEPGSAAKDECTIAHICELAATCARWLVECDTKDNASPFIDAAIGAMTKAAPPAADATSIIDFAAAMAFYDDRVLLEPAGAAPEACCSVITSLLLVLKINESLVAHDGSATTTALSTIAAAQAAVLARRDWTSWAADFQKAAKSGFASWSGLLDAYKRVALGDDPARDAAAARAAKDFQDGTITGEELFEAHRKLSTPVMADAFKAVKAMDDPTSQFTGIFGSVDNAWTTLKSFGKLGALATKVIDARGATPGESATQATTATVDIVKTILSAMDKLKVLTGLEQKELLLAVGRISVLFGVAVELFQVVDAATAATVHDKLAIAAHASAAGAGLLLLLAPIGVVGDVLVVFGTALFVISQGIELGSSGALGRLMKSHFANAFDSVFPKSAGPDTFEDEFKTLFGLDQEIQAVRDAFGRATFPDAPNLGSWPQL